MHFLLEEFKIFFKSSLSTQSLCHTVSARVRVGVWFWARSWSPTKKQGLCVPGHSYWTDAIMKVIYIQRVHDCTRIASAYVELVTDLIKCAESTQLHCGSEHHPQMSLTQLNTSWLQMLVQLPNLRYENLTCVCGHFLFIISVTDDFCSISKK